MLKFTTCNECKSNKLKLNCSICTHFSRGDYFDPIPKEKIINMIPLVGTDIDTEFSRNGKYWGIGTLKSINARHAVHTYQVGGDDCNYCRVRQDHWHSWCEDEDTCPIPDGLSIKIRYKSVHGFNVVKALTDYLKLKWSKVDAFIVLGTAENSRYKWQEEEESF